MIKTPLWGNATLIKNTPGRAISQQRNMFDIPCHSYGEANEMNREVSRGKYYQKWFAVMVEGYQWK